MAGGFFLVLPIVIGFFWGVASGRAMQGALVGLVVGLVLALALYLIDRAHPANSARTQETRRR